ncbi:hypothetical protein BED65_15465 [Listeria monocytogenes]|nr:hypothetical protein [Listeria monocytogenes]
MEISGCFVPEKLGNFLDFPVTPSTFSNRFTSFYEAISLLPFPGKARFPCFFTPGTTYRMCFWEFLIAWKQNVLDVFPLL